MGYDCRMPFTSHFSTVYARGNDGIPSTPCTDVQLHLPLPEPEEADEHPPRSHSTRDVVDSRA